MSGGHEMTDPNEPAHPTIGMQNYEESGLVGGLTKREYFAAMALSVICWHSALRDNRVTPEIIASEAKQIADALISELNK